MKYYVDTWAKMRTVYKATVTRCDNNHIETNTGLTGGTFKTRYSKHMSDNRNMRNETITTLGRYIWKLKREGVPYTTSRIILNMPSNPTWQI